MPVSSPGPSDAEFAQAIIMTFEQFLADRLPGYVPVFRRDADESIDDEAQ